VTIDGLLSRLEKVRKTGTERWIARCPAHSDRGPSLSIAEVGERILLHCFAGCPVENVLTAIGLTWDDVLPSKAIDHSIKSIRRPFPAADVLENLETEMEVLLLVAADMRNGKTVTTADFERALVAGERIAQARRVACG
jgi:phosphopantetheine adenylyltransferase